MNHYHFWKCLILPIRRRSRNLHKHTLCGSKRVFEEQEKKDDDTIQWTHLHSRLLDYPNRQQQATEADKHTKTSRPSSAQVTARIRCTVRELWPASARPRVCIPHISRPSPESSSHAEKKSLDPRHKAQQSRLNKANLTLSGRTGRAVLGRHHFNNITRKQLHVGWTRARGEEKN